MSGKIIPYNLRGSVLNEAALPPSGNQPSDAFLIATNLWLWDSTQWVDMGTFQGPAGPTGPAGTSVVIKGSVPSTGSLPIIGNTIGDGFLITGDLWVWDGDSWENQGPIRGPEGPEGRQGPAGTIGLNGPAGDTGPTGPAGLSVLSGNRAPIANDGRDGEFWIDYSVWTVYGPKAAGAWPSGISMIGPAGQAGDLGPQGVQGQQGDTGPAGPTGATGAAGFSAIYTGYRITSQNYTNASPTSYLTANIPATGTYKFKGFLELQGASSTDMTMFMVGQTGTTGRWSLTGLDPSSSNTVTTGALTTASSSAFNASSGISVGTPGSSTRVIYEFQGIATITTTGTFTISVAQLNADAGNPLTVNMGAVEFVRLT